MYSYLRATSNSCVTGEAILCRIHSSVVEASIYPNIMVTFGMTNKKYQKVNISSIRRSYYAMFNEDDIPFKMQRSFIALPGRNH